MSGESPSTPAAIEAPSGPSASENFELWIKMATDNKINSTNSWNFALIDYFHDMSLFRVGDSVNFQKASTTLDGCVKIYSSRIDSAASETGKLLSGLSSTKNGEGEEEGGEEEDEEDANEQRRAKQRQYRRNRARNTLAKDFDQIRMRDVEKEILANPIFKRALADFDEGGSKSLLMNMLRMSPEGRVMFVVTEKSRDSVLNAVGPDVHTNPSVRFTSGIAGLSKFVTGIESAKVCPSLDSLRGVSTGDVNASRILHDVGQIEYTAVDQADFGDYEDFEPRSGSVSSGVFSSDNDSSSTTASRQSRSQYSLFLDEGMEEESDSTFKSLHLTRLFDENAPKVVGEEAEEGDEANGTEMAKYFDQLSSRNWRGPEHWKISGVKLQYAKEHKNEKERTASPERKGGLLRKAGARTVSLLDFMADESDVEEEVLFKSGQPLKMMVSAKEMAGEAQENSLPEDLQFTTQRLVCLNLKPGQRIGTILSRRKRTAVVARDAPNMVADESFFADMYDQNGSETVNNDFFEGDTGGDFGGDETAETDLAPSDYDAPANDIDEFEAPVERVSTRHGTAGIKYARTSKRVDVRLLKEQLWTTLEESGRKRDSSVVGLAEPPSKNSSSGASSGDSATEMPADADCPPPDAAEPETTLKFSSVVEKMSHKYEGQAKKDLSTSFCFICLLHLANENGLTIEGTGDNRDLLIKR